MGFSLKSVIGKRAREVESADYTPAALARLIEKIRQAPIDPQPTENFYLEDVFEPSLYREILTRLPEDEDYDFIEHPDAVLPDGTKTRKLLDLQEETIARLKPEHRQFWNRMHNMLTSPALVQALMEKFAGPLHARFGEVLPEAVSVPILYRDFPGYRIGIHPDAPMKIVTLQFYFPSDNSQRHLGTTFHRREGTQFSELKTNDFKPNSAYSFVRTEESWHSVKQLAPHEQKRNTLAVTVYLKGQEYRSSKRYI